MDLSLRVCLKAVELQHHHARFVSMGVHRAAHLSALTMEDYPFFGIHTMEERTRLFHLVQMVKSLDLEYENEDGHDGSGASVDEVYAFTHNGYEDPDEDVYGDEEEGMDGATESARPSCVRKRLDFSGKTNDHHMKLRSHPKGSANVCHGNDAPVHGKGSVSPLQLEFDRKRELAFGYRQNNQRTGINNQPSHHCTRRDTKPETVKGAAMDDFYTTSSPSFVSLHRPKTRSPNKTAVHQDGNKISKKKKPCTEISISGVKPTIIYELKKRTGYNYGVPHSSPAAPNRKPDGAQRISVCVRKRPVTPAESRRGEADVVATSGGECVIVRESKEAVDLTQYILQHRFYFDRVFGVESSNEEVYHRTAYPLVQHTLSGGKATCFAYGQTGAGKTHTMLGSSAATPGLYALAARDVFARLSTSSLHGALLVYVSFFEIYCGHLYDLLDHRKRLFAREDGQKVVHIAGLREVWVDSVSSLLEVISRGTEERTQGTSGVNPLSSRSHALLKIQLRGPNQEMAGRIWFVDLAGSERASDTKEPDRQSRMEGAEINQSLLALKECIRSLDQEQSHTPFRQSKLTQVLKDSFIGDSMTCMIANISPGHLATEHTLNTLRYADRVKELRGQGGLKGGRRGKTVPSPKHNLSHSYSSSGSSSFGPRGKSPPKKQKLGRRKESFCPTTPNARMSTAGVNLCSTPKYSGWREDTSTMGRKGFAFELTPVRGWIGTGERRHRVEETKNQMSGRGGENDTPGRGHRARTGPAMGQTTEEQHHLRDVGKPFTPRNFGIYREEEESHQSAAKEEREEEKGWLQVGSERDTRGDVEKQWGGNSYKDDETQKERQRHLRQYHQQLQQFMSSSVSSSVSLLPPSTPSSLSSSNQTSVHSSTAPSSSSLSPSVLTCHGLKDVLDVYRAESSFPDGDAPGDSGGLDEDLRLSCKGAEAGFGHDRVESDKQRAIKAVEDVRLQREDIRPAGMERREERRWAWLEREEGDEVTDALATQLSNSCHSDDRGQVGRGGQSPTDDPAEGMWIPEGGGVQPQSESPRQRAPAERPLSPACELINTHPTTDTQRDLSLDSQHSSLPPAHKCSDARTKTKPISASITQTASKIPAEHLGAPSDHPDVKTKRSSLPQDDSHTDPHSDIMDPLSISLLQVDDPFSTASFCWRENEREADVTRGVGKERHAYAGMTGNVADDEDVDIPMSFLDLPRVKTCRPSSSDTVTAVTHRGGGKEMGEMANGPGKMNGRDQQIPPIIPLWTLKDLNSAQFRVVQAHWEQLEEMEALCRKEGTLLCQQPDMAFGEYVLKLDEIMERQARCVHSMRAHLKPYLKPSHSSLAHNQ